MTVVERQIQMEAKYCCHSYTRKRRILYYYIKFHRPNITVLGIKHQVTYLRQTSCLKKRRNKEMKVNDPANLSSERENSWQ